MGVLENIYTTIMVFVLCLAFLIGVVCAIVLFVGFTVSCVKDCFVENGKKR